MEKRRSTHVTLLATPDTQVAPLSGLYETLNSFGLLRSFDPTAPERPFELEIVAPDGASTCGASGLPTGARHTPESIERTDVAIIPLMMVHGPHWKTGRYPRLVEWLRRQHDHGAVLASACTGALLLAETGLLDGREATIHWAFEDTFRRLPRVRLRTEEVLIMAGDRNEFVMTGGVMSWHDLALHLIARYVDPSAAQSMARILMLEWHREGQAPYIDFIPRTDHGDALVANLQNWLYAHLSIPNPVEQMSGRSGVGRRTLERRFRKATGHTPIQYVQQLRIDRARRQLERTSIPVEQVAQGSDTRTSHSSDASSGESAE